MVPKTEKDYYSGVSHKKMPKNKLDNKIPFFLHSFASFFQYLWQFTQRMTSPNKTSALLHANNRGK